MSHEMFNKIFKGILQNATSRQKETSIEKKHLILLDP